MLKHSTAVVSEVLVHHVSSFQVINVFAGEDCSPTACSQKITQAGPTTHVCQLQSELSPRLRKLIKGHAQLSWLKPIHLASARAAFDQTALADKQAYSVSLR